jgi:diguanylate cyclase
MTLIAYLLVGAFIGGLVGMLAGWLARGREVVEKVVVQTVEKIVEVVIEKEVERPAENADPHRYEATEILAQLQQLTLGVSAKIDAHTRTVGDINEELSLAGAQEGSAVLTVVRRLIDSNKVMQEQLHATQLRLNEQTEQLNAQKEEARTDPLTQLGNRRAFDDELAKRIANFQRRDTPVHLMLLDVDYFKKFNDSYGHLAGDEVLRVVGRVLAQETHEKPGLFAARYGGEEFALLIEHNSLDGAALIGDRIRSLIGETSVSFESQKLTVTASAGIAELLKNEDGASLIARADEALYAAKKTGRNRACIQDQGNIRRVTPQPAAGVSPEATAEGDDTSDITQSMARRIAEWRRGGATVSMIVVRLDNSAALESKLGKEGLELAKAKVAEVFHRTLRDMDQIASINGEAFGLLLPTARLIDATRTAERIRANVDSSELEEAIGCRVTVSLGVAQVIPEDDSEALLTRARRAMESARRKGGNLVYINDGARSDPAPDRLDVAAETWATTP